MAKINRRRQNTTGIPVNHRIGFAPGLGLGGLEKGRSNVKPSPREAPSTTSSITPCLLHRINTSTHLMSIL